MKKLIWTAIVARRRRGRLPPSRQPAQGRARSTAPRRSSKGSVTQTVAATGTLSAVTTVKVGSVVSGNVAALHADFNKQVKKGDLLAELDPAPFQAQARPEPARRSRRRSVDLRNSEISLRRQKALWNEELAAQADLDQAQANYDSAGRRGQPGARRSLAQAETDLRNSRITAPIDGVVVDRQYDVGQSGRGVVHGPHDLHDRAGPDEDAGLGRRLGVRHRHVQGRAAGPLHRRRLSRADLPRNDRADPPERDRQPERRHLPGDHRGATIPISPCGRA